VQQGAAPVSGQTMCGQAGMSIEQLLQGGQVTGVNRGDRGLVGRGGDQCVEDPFIAGCACETAVRCRVETALLAVAAALLARSLVCAVVGGGVDVATVDADGG
jgi:hypothetical protein